MTVKEYVGEGLLRALVEVHDTLPPRDNWGEIDRMIGFTPEDAASSSRYTPDSIRRASGTIRVINTHHVKVRRPGIVVSQFWLRKLSLTYTGK